MADPGLHQMSKKSVVHALLAQGLAMIHLDPRRPGVDVPKHLTANPSLRLNISYKFQIPDFEVDSDGITCSLHFPDVGNHTCVVPWDSVFGATSQVSRDGRMWMESMPIEVRLDLARRSVMLLGQMRNPAAHAPNLDKPDTTEPAPTGPQLRVIDGGAVDTPPPDLEAQLSDEGTEDPPEPPKRPRLRLVK